MRRPVGGDLSVLGDRDRGLDGEVEARTIVTAIVADPLSDEGPALVHAVHGTWVPQARDALTYDALRYEGFYGLREKPFSLAPDLRFLYHSAAYDRAAQELSSPISRRDGLAILTGAAGIGKTMLCRALRDRVDRRTFTSFVADPFVTFEDLLKVILVDFGVISRADIGGRRLSEATRQELTLALQQFLRSPFRSTDSPSYSSTTPRPGRPTCSPRCKDWRTPIGG